MRRELARRWVRCIVGGYAARPKLVRSYAESCHALYPGDAVLVVFDLSPYLDSIGAAGSAKAVTDAEDYEAGILDSGARSPVQ